MNEIVINGETYVKKNSIVSQIEGDIKIVALQRGWVMIGYFEKNGNECKLYNSSTIRRWGTSNGLGQLAIEGKQDETILDKNNGVVEFDYLTVCYMISCEDSVWKKEL